MNISLIEIKYMPKKILQLIRDSNKSKQYKKMSFSVCHVSGLLQFNVSYEFWTFIRGKMYTYISFTIFYSALILKAIAFFHVEKTHT